YEKPQNLFVAQFIGTPPMSFFRPTVADGGACLQAGAFSVPVPATLRPLTAGRDGQRLVAGIRPENVREAGNGARGETARVPMRVEIVEPLGHEVIAHGRVGDDVVVAKLDPHHLPRVGDALDVVLELDALHLFDAETERRLAA